MTSALPELEQVVNCFFISTRGFQNFTTDNASTLEVVFVTQNNWLFVINLNLKLLVVFTPEFLYIIGY